MSGSATDTETGGGFGQNGMNYSLQGGISSFELDLFGKLANATRAERDTALATEAAARTVRLGSSPIWPRHGRHMPPTPTCSR